MRKYLLGIIAFGLAVGMVSFTNKSNAKKSAYTVYFFATLNNKTPANCSQVTLSFPTTVPPTSITSCSGSNNMCWISFSNYVQNLDGTYRPSLDGSNELTNYCSYSTVDLKN